MSILLSFTPFAVFFALMRLRAPVAGFAAAFATSAALCVHERVSGRTVKILEIGSLLLFGLLLAYTWLAAPVWTVATVRLAVDLGLLAIVLVSLAIRLPFTLQYARETVPEQYWAMPVFLAANRPSPGCGRAPLPPSWPPTPSRSGCPRCPSGRTWRARSRPS